MINDPVITLDCDWAPDFVLEYVGKILITYNVKSTWFVTNNSNFVQNHKTNPLFEFGLHPNFSPNSTQGTNPDEILSNMTKIIPNAKSVRTHGLIQSSNLLSKFPEHGIENDVSIILPRTKNIVPHYSDYLKLFRYPFFWEDDEEFSTKFSWSVNDMNLNFSGLKIFDFHPIHIFLNSNKINNYLELKEEIGLNNLNEKNIQKYVNFDSKGVGTFFSELVEFISNKKSYTIQDLTKTFGDEIKN